MYLALPFLLLCLSSLGQTHPIERGYIEYIRYPEMQRINLYFTPNASLTTYYSPTSHKELPAFKNKRYASESDSLEDVPKMELLDKTLKEHPMNSTVWYRDIGVLYFIKTAYDDAFVKYCMKDSIKIKPNWELLPDTLTIAGVPCQKARATFSTGTFDFWYATNIPLPFGPERLQGLPGIIMRCENPQTNYKVIAVRVQIPYTGNVLVAPCQGGKYVTSAEFDALLKKENGNQEEVLQLLDQQRKNGH